MKIKGLLLVVLLLTLGVIFVGCNDSEENEPNNEENIPTITVTKSYYDLEVGETDAIIPEIEYTTEELNIIYLSNNELVATVNNGVITAVGEGSTTIIVSLENYPDVKVVIDINVTEVELEEPVEEPIDPITIKGEDSVNAGESIFLEAEVAYDENNVVFWESLNPTLISVDQNGVVTGLKGGQAFIRVISLQTGEFVEKEITVITPEAKSVEIAELTYDRITLSINFKVKATVLPIGALQDVTWTSSDEKIATIDEVTGMVKPIKPGVVTMTATVIGTDISGEITFNVDPTPMEILESFHNENPIVKNITVYGWEFNYQHDLYASVNDYLNEKLDIIESLVSISQSNRPGILKESIKYITIHETASASASADATMHDAYVRNGGGGASWGYTVGNDGIYRQIPDSEVAFHAGDGSRQYTLIDTGVEATNTKNPVITISTDGYYMLEGIKSIIEAPRSDTGAILTTAYINDEGIETVIGDNGNWWMGATWYSKSFRRIGNAGGNRNSIGIESTVNQGSDIYYTWQKLAKLVAYLLEEHNLGLDAVKGHHYFSGKPDPATMKNNGLYDKFHTLIEAEYLARIYLSDYNVEFTSFSQHIDNRGRIISLPDVATRASYNVKITDKTGLLVDERLFYVNLPAKS